MTQLYFNVQGDPRSVESLDMSSFELVVVFLVDDDKLRVGPDAFSFLSGTAPGTAAELAALLKSKAVPGVFGVLVADPNDEKAPDPRPNAAEALPVGEDIVAVDSGVMFLKGSVRPPCELPPPKRLLAKSRDAGSVLSESPWGVERESLEDPERRVHRLSRSRSIM
jgi:hypothetical protein